MTAREDIERLVAERAQNRCEYCRMHQSLQGATFHVEHIVPKSRGGESTLSNLAWACPSCNLRKSDRVEAKLRESNATAPLYHPRRHTWGEHFAWRGYRIVGLSESGRATVDLLELNSERRLRIRQAEEVFELFPP